MSKRTEEQVMVEFLAENTDQIIAGEELSQSTLPAISSTDAFELLDTVQKLAHVIPPAKPDGDLRNRIRATLAAQWNVIGPGAGKQVSDWKSLFSKKRMAWAGAVLGLAALLLIGISITPEIFPAQTGAATFQPAALVAGLVILVIIALVLWTSKRK